MEVVIRTLRVFCEETSIAGVNNAAKGKSRARSIVWVVIFGVLAYFTVVGIEEIVLEYYSYPVITNTDLTHRSEVDFPAVTICNLNRVNCHNAFQTMYDIKQALKTLSAETMNTEKKDLEDIYNQL